MPDEDRTQVRRALANHEYLKPSYHWTSLGNAASRRHREKQLNFTVKVNHEGDVYQYDSFVQISVKNFYYTGRFTLNGDKKDVRLFKKLLN